MSDASRARVWSWAALIVILLGTTAIRARLLDVPLDRDEGEYAYMGQLLLQGVPPYVGAYSMKMPGIYGVYALILKTLGATPAAIHAGLAVANALAVVLVFLLAHRLFGRLEALTAALAFAVLTLSPELFGLAAYAEHFVLIPVVAGMLVLLHGLDLRRPALLVGAGVLLGAGFLVKQSASLFVAFAIAWAVVAHAGRAPRRWRPAIVDSVAILAGSLLPFALVCVAFALAGEFPSFWFWTFQYASTYVSAVPWQKALRNLAVNSMEVFVAIPFLITVAAAGAVALATDPALRRRRAFVGCFAVFSFLAVAPGLYFRHQYYILFLPAMALAAGVVPAAARRLCASGGRAPHPAGGRASHPSRPRLAIGVAAALVLLPPLATIWNDRFVLLRATPMRVSRTIYGRNPFHESRVVADYLRRHTSADDTIVVIGSEPQIYFYAGRRGATAYIYMYPLMERHPYTARMQEQMIRQIEAADPKFLVFVNVFTSWLKTPDSDPTIFRWLEHYGRRFERVGVVDIVSADHTHYAWDEAARTYASGSPPGDQRWLAVWRRRADVP